MSEPELSKHLGESPGQESADAGLAAQTALSRIFWSLLGHEQPWAKSRVGGPSTSLPVSIAPLSLAPPASPAPHQWEQSPPKCTYSLGRLKNLFKRKRMTRICRPVPPSGPLLSSAPASRGRGNFVKESRNKQCPNPRGANNALMEKFPARYQQCCLFFVFLAGGAKKLTY